ncbi:Uncharacterised protein [Vibrio cholerae]|nr:Uncharacterised protein [Vibrio cholerae]
MSITLMMTDLVRLNLQSVNLVHARNHGHNHDVGLNENDSLSGFYR